MEELSMHIFISISLIFLVSYCTSLDTITTNQEITDGNTLASEGGMFELGFFTPGKSKNRYLGIWYKKISTGTVVWVANRETPITDKRGIVKLSGLGNLVILNGNNSMIWSSTSRLSVRNDHLVVAQLLDNGNLVVWDKSDTTNENMVWQSFDYPGDTFLPGMKFGNDLVTGLQRSTISWRSPNDPSKGEYSNIIDSNGYPQHFTKKGHTILSRLGPWNGLGFSGFPIKKDLYTTEFVINEKEIFHRYELKGSVVQRIVVTWEGKTKLLQWIERLKDWIVYADVQVDMCDMFSFCGPYGICSISKHPPCICMQGFEPRNLNQWKASDWVGGCVRKKPLTCGIGDGFWKISRVKVPDTRRSWYNVSMTLGECEKACKSNCSCIAYSTLDIRNGGSGCLLWFDELIDTKEYDTDQDIYIRVDAAELDDNLDTQQSSVKKKRVLKVLLLTSPILLFVLVVAYAIRNIRKRSRKKGKGKGKKHENDDKHTSFDIEELDDLPFFSILEVARATCNFSVSNKIGEGGFGLVYKGTLDDGREIAVKRLSETSRQGLDEFKNEVNCIAKLQHRNLVKLLGYCIYENELILIYEYMPNKSLDFYLFDETRSLMLDWPQRLNIIHGIARGVLYLHQDSRYQIIHRDLKAGNVLLDNDMNPKISDFGLARNFVGHDNTDKTKKVVGTYGYISPEYAVHGRFSTKSDVFSFGVMVLEIISGKKNREFSHEDHSDNLLGHAWRLYNDGKSMELMSRSLQTSFVVYEVLRSIHVALLCVQQQAEDRPTMLSVFLLLISEGVLPEPKQPAFFTGLNQSKVQSISPEYTITHLYAR